MKALLGPEIDVGFLWAEDCTALLHPSMRCAVLWAIKIGGVEPRETEWPAAVIP